MEDIPEWTLDQIVQGRKCEMGFGGEDVPDTLLFGKSAKDE